MRIGKDAEAAKVGRMADAASVDFGRTGKNRNLSWQRMVNVHHTCDSRDYREAGTDIEAFRGWWKTYVVVVCGNRNTVDVAVVQKKKNTAFDVVITAREDDTEVQTE